MPLTFRFVHVMLIANRSLPVLGGGHQFSVLRALNTHSDDGSLPKGVDMSFVNHNV